MALRQEQEQLQSRIQSLMQRAPVWLAAQNSLNQLSEQCGESLPPARTSPYICNSCWSVSERRLLNAMKWARENAVDEEIERLSQPGGSED
ncbi:hypothetical protein ACLB1T_23545 [Escherichia coli]